MCRTLALNDFNVTYRESVQGSYDATLNGIPTELKKVDSSKQIYHHARKAFENQGAKAVVIEIATLDAVLRYLVSITSSSNVDILVLSLFSVIGLVLS